MRFYFAFENSASSTCTDLDGRRAGKYINYVDGGGGARRRGLWRRGCKLVRIKVMNINHTGGLVPRSFLDGLSRPCTDLADHCTIVSSSSPSSSLTVPARTFPLLELRAFAPSPGPGVAQLAVSKYRPIIHPSFPRRSSCLSGTHPGIAPLLSPFLRFLLCRSELYATELANVSMLIPWIWQPLVRLFAREK